jgi:hypothetical protein
MSHNTKNSGFVIDFEVPMNISEVSTQKETQKPSTSEDSK